MFADGPTDVAANGTIEIDKDSKSPITETVDALVDIGMMDADVKGDAEVKGAEAHTYESLNKMNDAEVKAAYEDTVNRYVEDLRQTGFSEAQIKKHLANAGKTTNIESMKKKIISMQETMGTGVNVESGEVDIAVDQNGQKAKLTDADIRNNLASKTAFTDTQLKNMSIPQLKGILQTLAPEFSASWKSVGLSPTKVDAQVKGMIEKTNVKELAKGVGIMQRELNFAESQATNALNQSLDSDKIIQTIEAQERKTPVKAVDGYKVKPNTYTEVRYEGTVKVDGEPVDVSRNVYQRSDFDLDYVDSMGRTNLERMKKSKPPIGYDGKSIELHHLLQIEPGPVVEIMEITHDKYYSQLHGLIGSKQSFRQNLSSKKQYNNFRKQYWKWRASQIEQGGGQNVKKID